MPRKPLPKWRYADALPRDVAAVALALQSFPQFQLLAPQAEAELTAALVAAVGFARAGMPSSRKDVGKHAETRQLLAADVMRAMKNAGVRVASWRQDIDCRDPEAGEALYYRVLRAMAALADVSLADDLFRLKKQADGITRN